MVSRVDEPSEISKSQDVLTFSPSLIKVIDNKAMMLLWDSKYSPITMALQTKPMTIKELTEAYSLIADEPKSEKTLYRYLKVLIDSGLVINAGQRVIAGRRVNETLYARTGRIFYSSDGNQCEWDASEEKVIFALVRSVLGTEKPTDDELRHLLKKWNRIREDTMAILGTLSDSVELNKLIGDIDLEDTSCLLNDIALLSWFFLEPGLLSSNKDFSDE